MKGNDLEDNKGFVAHRFQPIHGLGHTSFNNRYYAIRNRCQNPKNNRYRIYGARGIKCLWTDFLSFKKDMYDSFLAHVAVHGMKETQIDRIDPDGNYCKENCRWATREIQARNRKNIKPITYKGETKILSDWTKELGLEFSRTYQRIFTYGWSVEEAFSREKHINQFI